MTMPSFCCLDIILHAILENVLLCMLMLLQTLKQHAMRFAFGNLIMLCSYTDAQLNRTSLPVLCCIVSCGNLSVPLSELSL